MCGSGGVVVSALNFKSASLARVRLYPYFFFFRISHELCFFWLVIVSELGHHSNLYKIVHMAYL